MDIIFKNTKQINNVLFGSLPNSVVSERKRILSWKNNIVCPVESEKSLNSSISGFQINEPFPRFPLKWKQVSDQLDNYVEMT